MRKILFVTFVLTLTSVAFASATKGDPNYKHQAMPLGKRTGHHHAHIVVPFDHYSI